MTNAEIKVAQAAAETTLHAIGGAFLFGYQGNNKPTSDNHWLAEWWNRGRTVADLEVRLAALEAENTRLLVAALEPTLPAQGDARDADLAKIINENSALRLELKNRIDRDAVIEECIAAFLSGVRAPEVDLANSGAYGTAAIHALKGCGDGEVGNGPR